MPSINQATAFRAPSTVRAPLDFNRVFFQYQPPRPLHEIDAELATRRRMNACQRC